MKSFLFSLRRRKSLLLIIFLLVLFPLIFWLLSDQVKDSSSQPSNPQTSLPTVTPVTVFKDIIVTNISPADGSRDVDQNSSIRLTFTDSLPKNVALSLLPQTQGKYVRDEKAHTISFFPTRSFSSNTQYTVTLTIENRPFLTPDNESTSLYQWTFLTGQQQGESGISDEELEEMIRLRGEADRQYQERKQRLPFITSLPYQTSRFKVEIAATSDTVTITTFGTHRDYHTAYRQEALEWIRSKGGNPDTISIRYNPATL